MVDIHSHILYGIDDGAKTIEDSLAMLEIAAASGTTDIVATPHSNLRFEFDPETVDRGLAELRERAGERIRIHRGCDFHLYYDNIVKCMADPRLYTINGNGYLMVEFSEAVIPHGIEAVFQEMITCGITPVVTHPERNRELMSRVPQLADWVRAGCLIQITASSLTGLFGTRARDHSRRLLDQNLVHFVASDAHDPQYRTPDLRPARALIVDDYGERKAAELFVNNPKSALTGTKIEIEDPKPESEKKPWYQFW